jgi:hypothetical protein
VSEVVVDQKKFPYMALAAWTQLRRTYQKVAWPSRITPNGLASVLGWSEKMVANTLPQLRNMGFIDQTGAATDLAHDFRFADSYPDVCKKIIETTYPLELREFFPEKDSDPARVSQWIMRHSKSGEGSAKAQAKFYLNLVAAEPLGDEEPKAQKPRASRSKSSHSAAPATKSEQAVAASNTSHPITEHAEAIVTDVQTGQATPSKSKQHEGPSLHIDMQVHIDPAASIEQIDAIFASMAKHLYGR